MVHNVYAMLIAHGATFDYYVLVFLIKRVPKISGATAPEPPFFRGLPPPNPRYFQGLPPPNPRFF